MVRRSQAHDGIIPDDPKITAKCFEIQSQLNPRVSKPVGHIAISFKPEDKPRLTNEFMVLLAKEYMEKMGIKDTQYIIVRHNNTPNPIVTSYSTVWTTTADAYPTAIG